LGSKSSRKVQYIRQMSNCFPSFIVHWILNFVDQPSHYNHENWYSPNKSDFTVFYVYLQPLDDFRPPSPVTFTNDQMQLLQHLQKNRMNLDPAKLNLLHHLHTQFQLFQAYQMKMQQLNQQVIITCRWFVHFTFDLYIR